MEQLKVKPRTKIGYIAVPVLIYFAISLIVQSIYQFFLMTKVIMDYMKVSPELQELMKNANTSFSTLMENMNEFLTPEVIMELTLQLNELTFQHITYIGLISGIISIPVLVVYMRKDKKNFLKCGVQLPQKEKLWKYAIIPVAGICLCVAGNNLIKLSQLSQYSELYEKTSTGLYSASFGIQLVALGIVAPIAEELLFRGVVFNRLKVSLSVKMAAIWSSLVFAAFHVNLVQFIYALIMGLALAWIYEQYGSIKAPILFHIFANITSVVLTQQDIFMWIFEEPLRVGIITVGCATLAAVCYVVISNITEKPVEEVVTPETTDSQQI